jgi:predicted TIM-barrel fold metal-dependent hydrolase
MMGRRNSLMDEIPDLIIIGAHMGSLEADLAELGKTLDKYPNFYVEIGQRHTWFGQQPNRARKFFIKYQDRILFGQDGTKTVAEYRLHFRFLETDDDLIVFSKNRPPVYGLNLPDEVLRKVYYGNAAKLMPRVKTALQNQYQDLKFP